MPIMESTTEEREVLSSKKRKRVEHNSPHNSGSLALEKLRWSRVAFPERFEDAEGFFGLEEVSNVEVLRDPKFGRLEYRSALKTKKPQTPNTNEKKHDSQASAVQSQAISVGTVASFEAEGEWSGFGDIALQNDDRHLPQESILRKERNKQKKHEKNHHQRDWNAKKLESDVGVKGNSFAALDSDQDEDIDLSEWTELNLHSQVLSSLSRLKFRSPTPIQKAAIPLIRAGHEVVGKASTGSGKTLAFGIPIYEHVLRERKIGKHKVQLIKALILSPTRELAHQLVKHLTDLAMSDLSVVSLTGGLSLHKQKRLLAKADILIATPGRLWEILSEDRNLVDKLKAASFLVLDEADRLLSEGHFRELEEILDLLHASQDGDEGSEDAESQNFQTLVFSATFQKDLQQKLSGKSKQADTMTKRESMDYLLQKLKFQGRPHFIDVNPVSQMAGNLREFVVECSGIEKDLYLYSVILLHPQKRTLVFVNSITSVRRLTPLLQNLDLKVHAIHSQMPQKARLRALERFSAPTTNGIILIATDVAARGLDIPEVDSVLHYHVPHAADMYVHRSGRTARAERKGDSILLCAPEEVQGVRRLVAKVHARNALDHTEGQSKKLFIRTLELDRRVISRLRSRVILSKKISDAGLAKEKKNHEDNWLRNAAEDLGVDYDSDEFAAVGSKKGRGQGRKKRESEARGLGKTELSALKAELREELGKRVNVGVSETYLTAGGVDVDELLKGEGGTFLGEVDIEVDE